MTTAPPTTGFRMNTLGDIQEEEEEEEDPARGGGQAWGGGEMVMSPAGMTATPATGVFGDRDMVASPGAMTGTPRTSGYGLKYVESPGILTPASRGGGLGGDRKSTLPSVLELEHLTGKVGQTDIRSPRVRLIEKAMANRRRHIHPDVGYSPPRLKSVNLLGS